MADRAREGGDKTLVAGQSLAIRTLVAAGVWLTVALAAGGFLLSVFFRETLERNFDARLGVLLESLIGAATVDEEGIISLYRSMMDPRFDRPYSGWYWQISQEGATPFRSRSLWDQDLAIGDGGGHGAPRVFEMPGPDGQTLRVMERDIRLPGSEGIYHFAIAGDVSELRDQIAAFNRTLAWWLALLGAILLLTMAIQVRFGLRPLRRIRESLGAIRSGRARRLEGSMPKEIEPLARELNALLDQNEAVVERARKHAGNLAHALKTPLSVLSNEARASDGPLARLVLEQTAIMARHVDHHLSRARAAARAGVIGVRTPVPPAVDDLVRAMKRLYADRGLRYSVVISDDDLAFRGERQDLDDMLGNLLDNASKWAASTVRVTAVGDGDWIAVTIEDDGPGISEAVQDQVFKRGERLDESVPGSGLGLEIVKDLAEICGGSVDLGRSGLGGVKVVLRLPRATVS
ncbi:MAG: sensor histidine kinase [Alphaproteobacteria bacterium]|nr:MAG: sensor histidine kinase [Alphaproteobacteria bacterium]